MKGNHRHDFFKNSPLGVKSISWKFRFSQFTFCVHIRSTSHINFLLSLPTWSVSHLQAWILYSKNDYWMYLMIPINKQNHEIDYMSDRFHTLSFMKVIIIILFPQYPLYIYIYIYVMFYSLLLKVMQILFLNWGFFSWRFSIIRTL